MPVVPGLTDLQVIARGGYATVYRATQQSVGRDVAIKVENRTLDSERDQQRFLREARAAGRMSSHPHVVDLFDAGVTADQHPYLVMELCDGSYAERMRSSPLTAAEALDIGIKLADAVAHAHAAGVLHRDIKPANILHSHFNPAVLADFGLAVLAEARDASVTLEVLTPAYAPPETFRHDPPTPAVDVYALCATLYAVMYGRPPRWQTDRSPSLVTLMELFYQPIPDLPGVPPALVDVLRLGMANDPAARPTAEQLREMLTALPTPHPNATLPFSGSPLPGPPPPPPPPQPQAPQPYPAAGIPRQPHRAGYPPPPADGVPRQTPYPPAGDPPRRQRWRRWRWFTGGLATALLISLIGGGFWLLTRHPPAEPTPVASSTAGPGTPDTSPGQSTPGDVPASGTAAGGALPGCQRPLPDGARCTQELECYGPVRVRRSSTTAQKVPCAGRHTWEAYAVGDLPTQVDHRDHEAVKADPTVRQVCAEETFRLTAGLMNTTGWHLEVLPPTDTAVRAGDRVFHCLAGRGVDRLAGPTLAR